MCHLLCFNAVRLSITVQFPFIIFQTTKISHNLKANQSDMKCPVKPYFHYPFSKFLSKSFKLEDLSGSIQMDTSPYLLWQCVQNDSADSWLINSWITIWQSPIIFYSAFLHCAPAADHPDSHRTQLMQSEDISSVYFIKCATVLSLWENFILLFWIKLLLYILLTFEHSYYVLLASTSSPNMVWKQRSKQPVQLFAALLLCTFPLQCTAVNC